jgi:hypothetical protein
MTSEAPNKSMFFDRQAVISALDAAARVVLSKFGAFVRQAARSSIRTQKAISKKQDAPPACTGNGKPSSWAI